MGKLSPIGKLREINREYHTKGGASARGGERKFLFLRPSLVRSPVLRSGDRHKWSTYTQANRAGQWASSHQLGSCEKSPANITRKEAARVRGVPLARTVSRASLGRSP